MPELPEVETVVRGLCLSLPGRAIVEVRFGKTDFVDNPAEIAERLYLSVRTVETHRSHIQQKLRLSTRAELVGYALERGLISR